MLNIVRILGLDDDNHVPMFRAEDGRIFRNTRELVGFLARAHDTEYSVRMFSIVDQPSSELAKHDMEAIDIMFDYLQDLSDQLPGVGTDPDAVFDLFWDSASKTWW